MNTWIIFDKYKELISVTKVSEINETVKKFEEG